MATKGTNQKTRQADPNRTKNGKQRLGPLNLGQLASMLEKSSKPKEKSKINNRIRELKSRKGYVEPVVEVPVEETVSETAVAEPAAE
jgi:hypothetical protein